MNIPTHIDSDFVSDGCENLTQKKKKRKTDSLDSMDSTMTKVNYSKFYQNGIKNFHGLVIMRIQSEHFVWF